MCGVVALFSSKKPILREAIIKATQTLNHRGPDGQNYWVAPHQRVGLGHTQLTIMDFESGSQPIANEDGSLHVVVNGEFYDFDKLRLDLEQKGYHFKTNSDSEIVLHLYQEFGTQCLHHLRGEFAFVLWDERNKLLFAARDRFGVKPLYYARNEGTLYLASEAKAIFAAGVSAQWDHESFFQANSIQLNQDRTLFQGVNQIPPGHFLLASENHSQIIQYWDFNYPPVNDSRNDYTEEEYIEKVRLSLTESVRTRLRAEVPVGCFLSGGIDSSAILGIAAAHVSKPIHAFTIAFDHSDYDEQNIARETAEHLGAKLHTVSVNQSDFADHFSEAVWHSEMLCRNAHGVAHYLLSKAAHNEGFKVVLTGEGADEIFAGYSHVRRDMLLYNQEGQDQKIIQVLLEKLKLSNTVSSGFLMSDNDSMELTSVKKMLDFVPTWIETFSGSSLKFQSLYSPEFAAQCKSRDAFRIFLNQFDIEGQLKGREPVHQSLYLWTKAVLSNYILRIAGDGVDMAHAIEARLPFLDHQLIELVCNIPTSLKIRGMTEKYILREATRPFITNTVYKREKHPFFAPPSTLKTNGPFHELVQDTLRGSIMKSLPFFDQAAVIALLDSVPKMDQSTRATADFVLIEILSACILQQRFGLTANF